MPHQSKGRNDLHLEHGRVVIIMVAHGRMVPSLQKVVCYLFHISHPHESFSLLHFKNSFSTCNDTYYCTSFGIANPNSTISWDISKDCCTWSRVTCDEDTGHVIHLDLKCSGLHGILLSNNTIFSIGYLQSLSLSGNEF